MIGHGGTGTQPWLRPSSRERSGSTRVAMFRSRRGPARKGSPKWATADTRPADRRRVMSAVTSTGGTLQWSPALLETTHMPRSDTWPFGERGRFRHRPGVDRRQCRCHRRSRGQWNGTLRPRSATAGFPRQGIGPGRCFWAAAATLPFLVAERRLPRSHWTWRLPELGQSRRQTSP